jgi:hypothetical protein
MTDRTVGTRPGLVESIVLTSVLALVLSYAGRETLPRSTDFLCYWTAGNLLAHGQSPYDPAAQSRIQRNLGWDKSTRGGGRYEFLPYYYPLWFGLLCVPLGTIDYPIAERMWFFFNIECLLISALLLRDVIDNVPRAVPPVVLSAFFPTLLAVYAGQTSILILLLVAASWSLLAHRRDRAAGAILALLTIKPQLSVLILAGVMLWAGRRRRWGVVGGFAVGFGLLFLASTAVLPSWPDQMLRAIRVTPLPTEYWPWVGASWTLALRTLGLHGWALWLAYAAAAVPLTAMSLRAAWDRGRLLRDVLALSSVATFFFAPYAQLYDYPILVIPLLVILGDRLPGRKGTALLAAFLLIPYAQIMLMLYYKANHPGSDLLEKYLFIWIPIFLATSLCLSRPIGRQDAAVSPRGT